MCGTSPCKGRGINVFCTLCTDILSGDALLLLGHCRLYSQDVLQDLLALETVVFQWVKREALVFSGFCVHVATQSQLTCLWLHPLELHSPVGDWVTCLLVAPDGNLYWYFLQSKIAPLRRELTPTTIISVGFEFPWSYIFSGARGSCSCNVLSPLWVKRGAAYSHGSSAL